MYTHYSLSCHYRLLWEWYSPVQCPHWGSPNPHTTLLLPLPSPFPLHQNEVENWRHKRWRSWVAIRRIYCKQQWDKKVNSNISNVNNKSVQKRKWFSPKDALCGVCYNKLVPDGSGFSSPSLELEGTPFSKRVLFPPPLAMIWGPITSGS